MSVIRVKSKVKIFRSSEAYELFLQHHSVEVVSVVTFGGELVVTYV